MPLFRTHVEKFHAATGEYWVNRYFVNAADLGAALTAAVAFADAERPLYTSGTTITKVRADDNTANTDEYATQVLNYAGSRGTVSGDQLPLFVVARVDFTVLGGGRPSRKYLRSVLYELDTSGFNLAGGVTTLLQTYATAVCTASADDPDSQTFVSGVPFPQPGMRQLRRGSKKKVIP